VRHVLWKECAHVRKEKWWEEGSLSRQRVHSGFNFVVEVVWLENGGTVSLEELKMGLVVRNSTG